MSNARRVSSNSSGSALTAIAQLVCERTGIQLNETHNEMVSSRLQRRLIELKLASPEEYLEFVQANANEIHTLVGLLTTHHTFFFREFAHFEHLRDQVLPKLIPIVRSRAKKVIRIWSAASSRGQEAYSLAMFLSYHLKTRAPDLAFEIVGTDVDPASIQIAKNGVYHHDELKQAPASMVGNHWVRGTGEIEQFVKARASLRDHVRFETQNLIELAGYSVEPFDVIFCRNVFIYFKPEQIKTISTQLIRRLNPEGYLYVGISESLNGLGLGVRNIGPSVYTNAPVPVPAATSVRPAASGNVVPISPAAPAPAPVAAAPLRVMCVDDSPSVLTLLKQILTREQGYEIVATAKNGIEAAEVLKRQNVDLMTLDIHMPEQNGVEYLAKNFRAGHPPVVMVTSVSRDNAELALQALSSGAADYVEKPALSNLRAKGEEIRTKLRCAWDAAQSAVAEKQPARGASEIDRAFAKDAKIENPDRKLRMVYFTFSQRKSLKAIVAGWKGIEPPLVLWAEGAKETLPKLASLLAKDLGRPVLAPDQAPSSMKPGDVYLLDLETQGEAFRQAHSNRVVSILVLGEVTPAAADRVLTWSGAQLIVEDRGPKAKANRLKEAASDVVPLTSFAYQSSEFLCRK